MIIKCAFKITEQLFKILFITSILMYCLSFNALASNPVHLLKKQISSQDAVLLASPDGEIVFSKNADKKLIPASTLKVLTALVAINYLNPDYRFPTEFYIDADANLIIKGYGDPLLISEEITKIAAALKPLIGSVNDIILDDTFFEKPLTIPGTVYGSLQPYDSPNGALCVNFNTVNFKIENKKIVSAEPQTPIVEIARQKIESGNLNSGRILLTNNGDEITRYAGEIFYYFLQNQGIKIQGNLKLGKVNLESAKLLYRHISPYDLLEIIRRLLEYSNNFMANQILLASGASAFGPPATMEKAIRTASEYLSRQFGLMHASFVEGSGVSRNNQFTAQMFLKILSEFTPHHRLMKKADREYFKTGTLTGINTRVGYIVSPKGELFPFVVFINTPKKTTAPVMKQLKKLVQ